MSDILKDAIGKIEEVSKEPEKPKTPEVQKAGKPMHEHSQQFKDWMKSRGKA